MLGYLHVLWSRELEIEIFVGDYMAFLNFPFVAWVAALKLLAGSDSTEDPPVCGLYISGHIPEEWGQKMTRTSCRLPVAY